MRLETAERKGRFRLLLRLRSPDRYQLQATHPLFNRRLWTLDVDGDEARLVDYLQKRTCVYEGEAEIEAVPLGPFPFDRIPGLLLGYLPVPPAGAVVRENDGLVFEDDRGRRWQARVEGGVVVSWRLGEAEAPAQVHWSAGPDWLELVAEEEAIRLRWRQTVREPGGELAAVPVPAGSREGDCDLGWLRGVEDAPWDEEV
ncbi:MAG: hypothetical protein R3190_16585 [Thermoanaerobaculia bacterium]|nr:hypothetical protein [Thermoanaerobaculia bacterium]